MSQQNEDPRCQVSIKELNLLQKYLFQMDPVEDCLALQQYQAAFEMRLCACFSSRMSVSLSLQEQERDETDQQHIVILAN